MSRHAKANFVLEMTCAQTKVFSFFSIEESSSKSRGDTGVLAFMSSVESKGSAWASRWQGAALGVGAQETGFLRTWGLGETSGQECPLYTLCF